MAMTVTTHELYLGCAADAKSRIVFQ